MKLVIRNKFMSLRGNSVIEDEQGNQRFVVKGKFFSLTGKKFVRDMAGNTLYKVRNKIFNFFLHSCFIYDGEGNRICKVKQRFGVFKSRFSVLGYGHTIEIEGDIVTRDFTIMLDGTAIGAMHKSFFTLTDTFLLDCFYDEYAPLLIAIVIAIDKIYDRNIADNN